MSDALVAAYGPWARGWRFSVDDGEFSTGPVTSWCCTYHSIASPEVTLVRVSLALVEWRSWLEHIRRTFDARPPFSIRDSETARFQLWQLMTLGRRIDPAGRPDNDRPWCGRARDVLRWFMSGTDVPAEVQEDLLYDVVGDEPDEDW
ncbi:hypothetical protein GIS00_05405 [Nakamurella sp. YIM 132087]|uniref:Uncharacterized protein n=2 Tax=Nakamurella alba TaxID=2665158 RepID=A0A7K1FJE9_9ACTN|nr:hypothetical protein [Nakamurella alba]